MSFITYIGSGNPLPSSIHEADDRAGGGGPVSASLYYGRLALKPTGRLVLIDDEQNRHPIGDDEPGRRMK
jgi:hypothetical protein